MRPVSLLIIPAIFALSGCMTVAKTTGKAATLPFKAGYHGTKAVGKGAVGTTKLMGQTAFATGKGVYYVGRVPVQITDQALDTTTKVLIVTTQAVDLGGQVFVTYRQIQSSELDSELRAIRNASNILSVTIDAFA